MSTQLLTKIDEYERELEVMRQELATRTSRLTELQSKQSELQAHLSSVQAEIADLQAGLGVQPAQVGTNGHASSPANEHSNGTAPKKRARLKKVDEEVKPEPKPTARTRNRGETSLRHYILQALKGQTEPLTAKVVAERVKQQGYKTEAKKFSKVVLNVLGSMNEVENTPRVGYVLRS